MSSTPTLPIHTALVKTMFITSFLELYGFPLDVILSSMWHNKINIGMLIDFSSKKNLKLVDQIPTCNEMIENLGKLKRYSKLKKIDEHLSTRNSWLFPLV